MYTTKNLVWEDNRLIHRASASHLDVIPHTKWPGMFRVVRPDGIVSDMTNRARARDAAKSILLGMLNGHSKIA
jgi:hypothetical protein